MPTDVVHVMGFRKFFEVFLEFLRHSKAVFMHLLIVILN